MGSILSAIGGMIFGNAGQKSGLAQSEQATNTAASNVNQSTQAAIQNFLKLIQSQGQNPALSGQYSPMMLDPKSLATVSSPQMGSVYGGFNPGQVPGFSMNSNPVSGGTSGPYSTQWQPPNMSPAAPANSQTGGGSPQAGGAPGPGAYARGLMQGPMLAGLGGGGAPGFAQLAGLAA